jgi:hypothetical protein
VLTDGAALLDELDPLDEEVDPEESELDPLELDPSDEPVESDAELESSLLELDADESADAVALLEALRAGSWPVARVPKMTAQVARNSATVRAMAVRRIRRVRARRAARRGWTAASGMAARLRHRC